MIGDSASGLSDHRGFGGAQVGIEREATAEGGDPLAAGGGDGGILGIQQPIGNDIRDLDEFLGAHAARGHGRRAEANATGDKGRGGIEGHRVFVGGDVHFAHQGVGNLARHVDRSEIHQEQVIIRAIRNDLESTGLQLLRQGLSIGDHLGAVGFELWLQSFAEGYGFPGDHMLQWPTLGSRENALVKLLAQLSIASHDQAATWAA